MNWLNKYMRGRAGGDHFSIFLLLFSMIVTLLGRISGIYFIEIISYIPLFFGVYRMFSKNIQQRRLENYHFMIKFSPVYKKFHKLVYRLYSSKSHKLVPCTTCKTMLRVPKKKGRIRITCPKCKTRIIRKT